MNINTVDLNLFLVFQAIYATRSVTLAGDRLGMSQSAVSNALKRLRERFDDPLFVRTPNGMVPSAVAAKLIEPVEEGLAKLNQAIDQSRRFDPATSNQLFRIAVNDIGQLVLMPPLLAKAQELAPHVRFETVEASPSNCRQLMVDGEIDMAIGSWQPLGTGIYQQRLFEEGYVALLSADHELKAEKLELPEYLDAAHIVYRPSGASYDALHSTLSELNVLDKRKVVLTAVHSLGLSTMVANSRLLLSVPERLALAMAASRTGLRIAQLPFDVPRFPIKQQWHEQRHADAGHQWLRRMVFDIFNDLP
ncbi:MAG: LysR family transcriptional regulator [Polaromonas sp.]|uniref:LysR family transcriptional regulator n=1 Tax=Polaromonas sp. TaxID=1869339 RepID=UPI0025E8C2FE|nr:LysR family transcriptional regulator [Polaromonas sp.]MBI2724769.1 LysR family transcriptional regulator [Polaromonas sp.]